MNRSVILFCSVLSVKFLLPRSKYFLFPCFIVMMSKTFQEPEEKKDKKKEKGHGKPRQGDRKLFIPLFREPSSVEKILGDAEREHGILFRPSSTSPPLEQPKTPSFVPTPHSAPPRASPRRPASPIEHSPRPASPRVASPRAPSPLVANHQKEISYRPEPTPRNHHALATKIQAAFRGYMVLKSYALLMQPGQNFHH